LATPILAEIIATFLSNYITPQPISKVLPRPTLPSITMPTPTLQYSPTPIQTSAPPTTTPPPTQTTPIAQPSSTVTSVLGSVGYETANTLTSLTQAIVGGVGNLTTSPSTSVSASVSS